MRRQAAMKSFVISFGNIAIFTLFCFWKKSEKLKKVEESLSKISKSNPFYIKITFMNCSDRKCLSFIVR